MTDYSILSMLSYGKLHLKRITQNYDNESLWILNKVLDIKIRKRLKHRYYIIALSYYKMGQIGAPIVISTKAQ